VRTARRSVVRKSVSRGKTCLPQNKVAGTGQLSRADALLKKVENGVTLSRANAQ
jgi:hypothetical protein